MYENFTSFAIAFLHLVSSLDISSGVGIFRLLSMLGEIFDPADVAKLSIHTNLLGLAFLHLLQVVTLLGVLTKNGAVINLYAEASNLPSVVQHQVCFSHPIVLQKQAHLVVCIALNP